MTKTLKEILIPGFKYTIVLFDNEGFGPGYLMSHTFTFVHLSVKRINGELVYSIVTSGPASLKWLRYIKFKEGDQFILYKGDKKINTAKEVSRAMEDTERGAVMVCRRWPAYDPRYMLRAKFSIREMPLAEFIKPKTPELRIVYKCIS